MRLTDNPNQIARTYGIYVAVALIIYFWIAWFFGFINVPELRLLNLVIQTAGIYFAYRQFKRTHQGYLNYIRALVIGLSVSIIGTSIFAIFLFLLFQFDHNLFESIIKNETLRVYLTVYTATFAVWTEGIVSGTLATFLLTNVMDTDQP